MNPLIPDTPSINLILPLSQLSIYCNRLINSINNVEANQKNRILHEQTLWSEVKKIKSTGDKSVFLYLTGFYQTVLFKISQYSDKEDNLHYNVMIRMGDLSRYMGNYDVAEYYYWTARNLYPCYGHAYNQLGLLTEPKNFYKCCYYYARAARASDKPLVTIADSNIKMAVKKYGSELLKTVIFLETESDCQSQINNKFESPESSSEWFYLVVLAIYADNIAPVAKLFLDCLNENLSTQTSNIVDNKSDEVINCSLDSYLLLASFDILLDWFKHGSQFNGLKTQLLDKLHRIRSTLQTISICCDNDYPVKRSSQRNQALSSSNLKASKNYFCNDLIDTESASLKYLCTNELWNTRLIDGTMKTTTGTRYAALPHDYVLSGFKPLEMIHRSVIFESGSRWTGTIQNLMDGAKDKSDKTFIDKSQLLRIVWRLKTKLDQIILVDRKFPRATRNIALQSILCKFEQDN